MFSIFKIDPIKKLRKSYKLKLEQAMLAQRNGDIKSYSFMSQDAQNIWEEIQTLEAKKIRDLTRTSP
jgi:hypothetical protein